MNFNSPSGRLAIPFVLIAITGLMIGGQGTMWSAILLGIGLSGVFIIFLFRAQIHWYYYSKNPPPVSEELMKILHHKMPYFRQLTKENKIQFMRRISIFSMCKDIESLSEDTVPADIRGLIAAAAVQLTFGKDRYLLPNFKKIMVYPSLFRSVQNTNPHGSETFLDEEHKHHSCLVFAADRLMLGVTDPAQGYNIALHEMAMAYKIENNIKTDNIPYLNHPNIKTALAEIRGANYSVIKAFTQNKELDVFGLAIEHFFTRPANFQNVLPDLYQYLCELLNQNPLQGETPVLKDIDYSLLLERHAF